MGFLDGLFGGSEYASPGWMRGYGQDALSQYWSQLGQMYGPDAFRRQAGRFTEDYDRNLRNQDAAGMTSLAGRGMQGGSGTLFGRTRANDQAQFRSGLRDRMDQGRLGGLQGFAGMLGGMGGLYQKQRTPGILGGLGALAGAFAPQQGIPGNDIPYPGSPPFLAGGTQMQYPAWQSPNQFGMQFDVDPWMRQSPFSLPEFRY